MWFIVQISTLLWIKGDVINNYSHITGIEHDCPKQSKKELLPHNWKVYWQFLMLNWNLFPFYFNSGTIRVWHFYWYDGMIKRIRKISQEIKSSLIQSSLKFSSKRDITTIQIFPKIRNSLNCKLFHYISGKLALELKIVS